MHAIACKIRALFPFSGSDLYVPWIPYTLLNVIRSLNPNKAHGWDEISVKMIKSADASLVTPLMIIFTNCLRQGVFPEIWKCANIVPVHKKNEKNRKSNYRPIPLLLIFGKILEKLMYDSLYSHLVSCELLNPNQSGFRPGDSTINQLICITHTIFKAFDCNRPLDVRSVYLDISKAFDRVWHDGLIYNLWCLRTTSLSHHKFPQESKTANSSEWAVL